MLKKNLAFLFIAVVIFTAVFLLIRLKNKNLAPIITPTPTLTPQSVSILFLGDTMLSRGVAYQITKNNDLYYSFQYVKDYLLNNDFVFSNLESPVIDGKVINAGEMFFRTDEKLIPILKEMNFSIVSLANNHMLDMGQKGLLNTFNILKDNNIQYAGAGKNYEKAHELKILEKNGIKFAFLAYNDNDVVSVTNEATENKAGTAFMNLEALKKDVEAAELISDFVIVSMHSGDEYQLEPNQRQINFAHTAIDNGADLVIGHHPHIVQKYEKYKNGYIFYSLGNFIFDQMWSQETREGVMIKIVFGKDEIKTMEATPYIIENFSQPRIINKETEIELYQNISDKLKLIF